MESPKYKLNREDLGKVGQTLVYSTASVFLSTLIVLIGEIDWGAYAILVPMVNAILHGGVKFFQGKVE